MSLQDAKRLLQWNVVMSALADADIDAETIAVVESARHTSEIVKALAGTLQASADAKQAKNYVKVDMVGMVAPFDRAYIELVRPGGKTSHELRELLRSRLQHVRNCLTSDDILDVFRADLIQSIDEDLTAEAP